MKNKNLTAFKKDSSKKLFEAIELLQKDNQNLYVEDFLKMFKTDDINVLKNLLIGSAELNITESISYIANLLDNEDVEILALSAWALGKLDALSQFERLSILFTEKFDIDANLNRQLIIALYDLDDIKTSQIIQNCRGSKFKETQELIEEMMRLNRS